MRRTNALELRRSLGKVLRSLEENGAPIMVEKARRPKAVLISLRDFQERFVDVEVAEERRRIAEEILSARPRARRSKKSAVSLLRELRGRLP